MKKSIKNKLEQALTVFSNYKALNELAETYPELELKNIHFSAIRQVSKEMDAIEYFYHVYENFKELDESYQRWTLENTLEKADILKISSERLEVFSEKVSLCSFNSELVEQYKPLFQKMEFYLSDATYQSILYHIRSGKIVQSDIEKLSDCNLLLFINEHSDLDISVLLEMNEENRSIFMRSYQSIFREMIDYDYSALYHLKSDQFTSVLNRLQASSPEGNSFLQMQTYEMLEELAKEYGDTPLANFVFSAFPLYDEAVLEEGEISEQFKRLVEAITADKTKEELDSIKEEYYEFLNVDKISMRSLRYQTILSDAFIQSKNKSKIMDLLHCDNRIDYQNRERMLIESGFFDVECMSDESYQFIKDGVDREFFKERIHLVLTPNIDQLANRDYVLERMNHATSLESAKKISAVTQSICNGEVGEEEKKQLLESLAESECRLENQDYSVSIFGLDSFDENSVGGEIEVSKGALKLIIRRNNTCKK